MALEKGYHVLLEKPIGCTWDECIAIRNAQIKARRLVLTGYVLRFAPFYKKLREVITSGVIGDITSVHHLAAISYGKASHAYCRGNWSVEEKGTGMLVNKCTHDFDLIEWWTKGKKCTKISSFGSLFHWRPENRPEGAADRCKDCPAAVREKCAFDAYKLYYDRDDLRYHFADESDEAILKMIETSPYGRCVYACGNDSVDHQTVLMEYEGGLTIILEMESYSQQRTRVTHFYGTKGEIIADERKIEIMPFLGDSTTIIPAQTGHHGGGDREIMTEFVKLVRDASPDRYTKILDAALESHRIAFLAEESRYSGKTIIESER
jgi:predicted dehydrogenase